MKSEKKITEAPSHYDDLELMSTEEILLNINREDQKIAGMVAQVIPQLQLLVDQATTRMQKGGRLFYIGAGTSGRLGILDASEIPPTFGYSHEKVIGLIAGGDQAIRKAVEFAEDDAEQAWKDLNAYQISPRDVLVGIAASGTTPYVIGGIQTARAAGILTAGITNNPGSPLAQVAEIAIEIDVGPEFVTGSTRMKSGTSQKLALNMISTAIMIRLGRVKGNKMINMQLNNNKLRDRGIRILQEELKIDAQRATDLLEQYNSVEAAIRHYQQS